MAPLGSIPYTSSKAFDSALEDALKNSTPLLSWKSAFLRLHSPRNSSLANRNLKYWLLATSQLSALSSCYVAYPPPNTTSRKSFETKTAAINVTSESTISILQVKSEALALSSLLNIDELEALRICILEYQERIAYPDLETQQSTDPNFGAVDLRLDESLWKRSIKRSRGPGSSAYGTRKDGEVTEGHLVQQVKLYFSERRYLIKVATSLVRSSLDREHRNGTMNTFHLTGKKVLQHILDEKHPKNGFLESLFADLESRAQTTLRPRFIEERKSRTSGLAITIEWEKQTLLQQVHLLQLVFILVYKPVKVSPSIMEAWIRLMQNTNFLMDQKLISKPVSAAVQTLLDTIAPLVSLDFLTVISLPIVTQRLLDIATGKNNSLPGQALYVEAPNAIRLLHNLLCKYVGERADPIAALAGWSWAILLNLLKLVIEGSVHGSTSSGRLRAANSVDTIAIIQNTLEELHDVAGPAAQPSMYLAQGAMRANLLTIIEKMFTGIGNAEGWSIGGEVDAERMRIVLAALLRAGMDYMEFDERVLRAIIITHGTRFNIADCDSSDDNYISSYNDIAEMDDFDPAASSTSSSTARSSDTAENAIFEPVEDDVIEAFWSDSVIMGRIMNVARGRFPYESLSFLSLVHSVTPRSVGTKPYNFGQEYLSKHIRSCTVLIPPKFTGTEVDVVDADMLRLTEPLTVVPAREDDQDGAMIIPAGVQGAVLSIGVHPPVVRWDFQYSALQYLGRSLEIAVLDDSIRKEESSVIIEVLGIFENILKSCRDPRTQGDDLQCAMPAGTTQLLEEASDLLAQHSDIVSVIIDLFENGLSSCVEEKDTEFVSAAIRVIAILLPILPGRVWPFLGRSSLMERYGRDGNLTRIVESLELVRGDYSFLLECLTLYEGLVHDAIRGVVVSGTIGVAASVVGREGVGAGVSCSVQTGILELWTMFFGKTLERFRSWKYVDVNQRTSINRRVFTIFSTILTTVYGVDPHEDRRLEEGLFGVLCPAARYIVSVFLSSEQTSTQLEPVSSAISDGSCTPESSLYLAAVHNWTGSVICSLKFANIIIRIRSYLGLTPSQLERQLYSLSPRLVLMYGLDERYRLPVIELFETLISNSGAWPEEPPSLLGHLGQTGAKNFVSMLKRMDGRIGNEQLQCAIWRFFSAVVSNKQQGLSILLVTGAELGSGADEEKATEVASTLFERSMLQIALDALSNISQLPSSLALTMLEAVSLAQNFWGAVTSDIRKHPHFLTSISSYVADLKVEFLPADTSATVTEKCNHLVAAAYIAQLLAMHLHQMRALKVFRAMPPTTGTASIDTEDTAFLSGLIPKLTFYVEKAVNISGYKPSMHGFLMNNFQRKWPACKLDTLKKSAIQRRDYGAAYFYDVQLATTVLGWDIGWENSVSPKGKGKASNVRWGFRNDVEKANLNLSLVDAQVTLLRAWSFLAIELTAHISSQPQMLPTLLVKTIKSCLRANVTEGLPTPISLSIVAERANFAFTLLSRLQSQSPPISHCSFAGILDITWQSITISEQTFREALTSGQLYYFRALLRILYIVLKVQATNGIPVSTKEMQTLVEIFELVIAKGFKDLAVSAYQSRDNADPADMLLIIGILQVLMSFKSIEPTYHSLIAHLVDHDTIRAALTLFTWAIKLAPLTPSPVGEPDPIYGALSVSLLVKLSTVPSIAEQVALSNVFTSLSVGELSERIQAGDLTPITTPRLHEIWTRNFLPLILNMLFALGPRIANETNMFLRSFSRQISTAVQCFANPKHVSIPQIAEITDIVAITAVLESMGVATMDDFGVRKQVIDAACDKLLNHKAWTSTMIAPTTSEEDVLWEGGVEGSQLMERIIHQIRAVQELVNSPDFS